METKNSGLPDIISNPAETQLSPLMVNNFSQYPRTSPFTFLMWKRANWLNASQRLMSKAVIFLFSSFSTSPICLLLISLSVFACTQQSSVLSVFRLCYELFFSKLKPQKPFFSLLRVCRNQNLAIHISSSSFADLVNIPCVLTVSEYHDRNCTVYERGRKVACGSSEGTIYLFNWNGFGATSDRFAVKAESIDCMVPITDNILCAGSMDGVIRAINILPNRVIGSVGQHPGEPIEQLAKSADGKFLASCAHDLKVKFWDLSSLNSIIVDDYRKRKKNKQLTALSRKAFGGAEDFFADLQEETGKKEEDNDENESDSDDSDSD
ncbi:WD repeat-containing 55 isoform X1 [Pelobates cultripes]|uniref:WD repeat-containing 55 isoform X1 n=1 Tax=Pelobates cultripes TaxID=61616 RepID=A0AAD1RPW8_PELCU|nr:WD repeat-containing 55 isoform X1 [Pelobates cultripes]